MILDSVTEFSHFAIQPGLNIWDEESDEGKVIAQATATACAQPGAGRIYYGPEVENPQNLWMFTDWARIEDHLNYRKSDAHEVIIPKLESVLDMSRGFVKHVAIKPYPPQTPLADAPVTEVLTAFLPPEPDPEAKVEATRRLEEFIEKALKTCPDFKGTSYGWSLESDVPIRGDPKCGTMLVAFIGWSSVEAHMRFRETDEFKDNIGLLRTIPSLIKLGAFHVTCKSKAAK